MEAGPLLERACYTGKIPSVLVAAKTRTVLRSQNPGIVGRARWRDFVTGAAGFAGEQAVGGFAGALAEGLLVDGLAAGLLEGGFTEGRAGAALASRSSRS